MGLVVGIRPFLGPPPLINLFRVFLSGVSITQQRLFCSFLKHAGYALVSSPMKLSAPWVREQWDC